jgi:hypothetical protein
MSPEEWVPLLPSDDSYRYDWYGRVGHPRRPHPIDRGSVDLLLVERLLPKLLERPELDRERRRFHLRTPLGEVLLDVLTPDDPGPVGIRFASRCPISASTAAR